MKSDGVATATMEPEAGIGVEPVNEAAPPGEEQQQQPPPQPENKPATEETTPPADEEVNDKVPVAQVKPKTKGSPVKGKPGAAAGKATGTTGTSSKTNTAQQRTSNGDRKTVSNGVAKKTVAAAVEKKTTASVAPAKRPVGTATSKVAERKPAAARPATAPASSCAAANGVKQPPVKKMAASTGTTATAKVRPSTAGSKPGTTVQPSRASSTVAAKTEKAAAPKTARPAASSRPATSAAPRPAPARAGVSAPSSAKPAASQPSKTTTQPSRTTALPSKTGSAPAKKGGAERKEAVVPTDDDNMGAQKDKGEIEKADAEINEDDEIRSEEDFSHSSVSEMGESQATEERSKTVAEQTEYMERSEPSGIDMHQGLTSEMDSEDVSQPCMSELSAPQSDAGLLEGMESMDDLREVGRGGSPDIGAAPDVQQDYFLQERGAAHPVNALDSEDREYDMDVGSEKADPESAENVEQEDDEDVEMVSEVITESGLESYGNPDEDDLVEEMSRDVDLKTPDNLNFLSAAPAVVFEVPEHAAQAVQPPTETKVPENHLSENNPFVSFTPEADASPVLEEPAGFQLNSAENIMDPYNADLQEDTTFSATNMEGEPQSVETVFSEKGASDSACMGVELNSSSPDELPTPVCETPTEQELLYSMAAKPQSLPVESLAELCKQAELHNPPKTEKEAAPGSPQEEADKLPFESLASPPEREPEKGLSKSSTLSGPELAAQSSSETSTPEELKDYDSSSGVESKSEEKLGGIQLHHQIISPLEDLPIDQDLGIHLEKGDEETETLPADDILGDPPTESVASSEDVTEEDHSDTEGEMLINDPGVVGFIGIDNVAFEEKGKKLMEEEAAVDPDCKLPAGLHSVDEYEEQHMMFTDAGGPDTPHSTNSVASYAFDCTSNAHSMTESCSKSPGIFSLENEDQLLEESKDPTLMKELNLQQVEEQTQGAVPTAPDSKGMDSYQNNKDRNVDLLPLEDTSPCETVLQLPKSGNKGDCEYMFCVKPAFPNVLGNLDTDCSSANTGMPNMISDLPSEESDRDSPDHALNSPAASPSDGDHAPPYYSAICETTDSMLTGDPNGKMQMSAAPSPPKPTALPRPPPPTQILISPGQHSPSSVLSTIYEAMETTEDEEEELDDDDVFEKELGELGGDCESERNGDQDEHPLQTRKPLLLLGCGKADMVEQLINQTLLISGERTQLLPHKGGTISEVEIGQWTQLISPMDDSRASITSVTSYSPEDTTSPHGDWTVVELETHH
ncbi:UNVERIFIED_CONTAM: hypothetical protein FKN15_029501 [Acipenser sinensis]